MIKELQKQVEQQIASIKWIQQPTGLYEPIEYVLSLGGKRIRPVLTLLACRLFSGDEKAAMPAASTAIPLSPALTANISEPRPRAEPMRR